MKVVSYNINGLRAALQKGLYDWLRAVQADMVCFQEIKISSLAFPVELFESLGYHSFIYPAQKPGYSGVAILSKQKPLQVRYGCGIESYDKEGRIIQADFEDYSVMSVYVPSGSSSEKRQEFKIQFLDDFKNFLLEKNKEAKGLIIAGDYNICHQSIDIHNPKANANNPGFLPEERAWFSELLAEGFVDSFRSCNPEPHHYTWWSYRNKARERNLGWRIDYQIISQGMEKKLKRALILSEAMHSDHCPTLLEIEE